MSRPVKPFGTLLNDNGEAKDLAEQTDNTINSGDRFVFDYPKEFVTLPEYSNHRGSVVTVVRPLTSEESDFPMYLVVSDDGWTGHAFEEELLPLDI